MTNLNTAVAGWGPQPPQTRKGFGGLHFRSDSIEDLIAQLKEPIRFAGSAFVICAAAGDYAAGDVLSNSATDTLGVPTYVPSLARSPGGVVQLVAVRAVCAASNGAVLAQVRLHWFHTDPLAAEVEMDDNAAFSIATAAGSFKWVGSTLLNPFVDRGAVVSTSDTPLSPIEPYRCAPDKDGLWFVAVLENAEANESANMSFKYDFYTL